MTYNYNSNLTYGLTQNGWRNRVQTYSGAISLFDFLSPAQITAVQGGTGADVTTSLQSAINAGVPLIAPPGTYFITAQINLPDNAPFFMAGFGPLTIFHVLSGSLTQAFYRAGVDVTGADVSPTVLKDFIVDCGRHAGIGIYLGAGKGGFFEDLTIQNYTGDCGFQGGDSSGATSANFYENRLLRVKCDGGIGNSGSTSTMPDKGLLLTANASDNVADQIVGSYIVTAAVDVIGGNNIVNNCHGYGNNTSDTGPLFCVRAGGTSTQVGSPECDNVTQAGVQINANGVVVTGGSYYWSAGNTPATTTGAVPIEISASGPNSWSVVGGSVEGANSSNPTIRYLGSHVDRSTVFGPFPTYRSTGDIGVNHVERSFSITKSIGVPTFMAVDTVTGQTSMFENYVNGHQRTQLGTDGTSESGLNAGSNWVFSTYADDGTTKTDQLKFFRSGSFNALTPFSLGTFAKSGVPSPSAGLTGYSICVTDCTALPTYQQNLTAVTGGGALSWNFICPDGVNWIAAG